MSQLSDPVYLLDEQGRCVFANPRATVLRSARGLLGRPLDQVFPSLTDIGWHERLSVVTRQRSAYCGSVDVRDWGGRVRCEMYPTAAGLGIVVTDSNHHTDAPSLPDFHHQDLVQTAATAGRLGTLGALFDRYEHADASVFAEVLNAAIAIAGARHGLLQTVDVESGLLATACQSGTSLASGMHCTPATDSRGVLRALISTDAGEATPSSGQQHGGLRLLGRQTGAFLERTALGGAGALIEASEVHARFAKAKRASEEVIQRSHELGVQFVDVELDLVHTFLDYAGLTRYPEAAVRCREAAQRALMSASRALGQLDAEPQTLQRLEQRFDEVRRRLEARSI